jgi:hypothetical protein
VMIGRVEVDSASGVGAEFGARFASVGGTHGRGRYSGRVGIGPGGGPGRTGDPLNSRVAPASSGRRCPRTDPISRANQRGRTD